MKAPSQAFSAYHANESFARAILIQRGLNGFGDSALLISLDATDTTDLETAPLSTYYGREPAREKQDLAKGVPVAPPTRASEYSASPILRQMFGGICLFLVCDLFSRVVVV